MSVAFNAGCFGSASVLPPFDVTTTRGDAIEESLRAKALAHVDEFGIGGMFDSRVGRRRRASRGTGVAASERRVIDEAGDIPPQPIAEEGPVVERRHFRAGLCKASLMTGFRRTRPVAQRDDATAHAASELVQRRDASLSSDI